MILDDEFCHKIKVNQGAKVRKRFGGKALKRHYEKIRVFEPVFEFAELLAVNCAETEV